MVHQTKLTEEDYMKKLYHPCRGTCSGYKAGFDEGKKEIVLRLKNHKVLSRHELEALLNEILSGIDADS